MGIGSLARASGLSVSALRFYDAEGVLVPAEVDPHTGYRRYTGVQVVDARLVAELRRTAQSGLVGLGPWSRQRHRCRRAATGR